MRDKKEFDIILRSIDGNVPVEYGRLAGDFDFTRYVLHSLRVLTTGGGAVADAVAVIHVPQLIAGFPPKLFETPIRRTALEDYLTRRLAAAIDRRFRDSAHAGTRAPVSVARPGCMILPRSALIVSQDYVEARVMMRLPVRDGRIDAIRAGALFFEDLPAIVSDALIYCYIDESDLEFFIRRMEDDDAIRQSLSRRGLVAFIAAGGSFQIADDLAIEIETPNAGRVRGAGLPTGITLVIGDRHSGRPELMRMIADGVYNRVPSAENDRVITISDAVEIVSEPGRPVQRVDTNPFLRDSAADPAVLTCDRADALESQIASVVEALQAGSQTLIVDEAFSTPDFLAVDPRLAPLCPISHRRYAALSERARQFADEGRVSWVIGAEACASALIPSADFVLVIEKRTLRDATREAKALGLEAPRSFGSLKWAEGARWIFPSSIDPACGREDARIEAEGVQCLRFGASVARLSGVTQLAEEHQTRTIGLLLYYAKLHYLDENRTVTELLDLLDEDIARDGLDSISREVHGDMARPRRFEIAAALNRLESLRVSTRGDFAAGR